MYSLTDVSVAGDARSPDLPLVVYAPLHQRFLASHTTSSTYVVVRVPRIVLLFPNCLWGILGIGGRSQLYAYCLSTSISARNGALPFLFYNAADHGVTFDSLCHFTHLQHSIPTRARPIVVPKRCCSTYTTADVMSCVASNTGRGLPYTLHCLKGIECTCSTEGR
jgi:hypothetical protein